MAGHQTVDEEETVPLTQHMPDVRQSSETERASDLSASTTSLVFDDIHDRAASREARAKQSWNGYSDADGVNGIVKPQPFDLEDPKFFGVKSVDRKYKRILIAVVLLALAGWCLALFGFMTGVSIRKTSEKAQEPVLPGGLRGPGKRITLDSVLTGEWIARSHDLSWISGANGEDGMILERAEPGKDYLVVENVRHRGQKTSGAEARTLMKDQAFKAGDQYLVPTGLWPSPDLKHVLIITDAEKNWRHSSTGRYWIFDVETQQGEALDLELPNGRVQLASWAPDSRAIAFTRDNNLFIRVLNKPDVIQVTTDGGAEFFNGVPDWVYEEEVFAGNSATWWSKDSKYIAFLKTNESQVPTYPVQFFLSRPSGKEARPGEENYPEVRQIKYPKAGAPNPVVSLQFWDVRKKEVFAVDIEDDFADDGRLITEVLWAGETGKVIVRETNRESDILKVVLIDVANRNGKTTRTLDVNKLDGGWFEVSQTAKYVPSDPTNGRPDDGYIDTVIHEGYDHLAYFTPLNSSKPIILTSGEWEVVDAPSAVNLKKNIVYFVGTRESSIERHVYSVKLDGTDLQPIVDTKEAFYSVKFSSGAGYALISYKGPEVPWQKVVSTPGAIDKYEDIIEDNSALKKKVESYALPILIYSTINIDGFELNVLERRPPHFNKKHKYPVLFFMYQGPGSQSVHKTFTVDFQAHVASMLGYIVVTVDGRGTGFRGRKTRCIVRGNIGHWESHDQIAAAKMWAAKKYVDENKMAIWGWSYGGYMTLKTLEQDAGETFKYGMAVAPVTDWRFYDSIYTERYMHTPQNNPSGYDNASIRHVQNLGKNVRFLFMHGVADDNVHYQSTLTLMDKLDLANIENYDMQVFPDSDHSIYFHNANRIVYDKLSNWLVNAFNGEWLKTADPSPIVDMRRRSLAA